MSHPTGKRVLVYTEQGRQLELYEKHREEIRLVILDLLMPGMGGKRCIDVLLKMDPKLRVLITNGYAKPGIAEELKATGVSGFILKSFDMGRMLEKIRKIIDED